MRLFATLMLTIFAGCATIVPDYQQNKVIDKPIRGPIEVRVSVFGVNCADTTFEGQPAKVVWVGAWVLEETDIFMDLNGFKQIGFDGQTDAFLKFPAGIGHHVVTVWTLTHGPIKKSFDIVQCQR